MKLNQIAIASLVLVAGSSFATTPTPALKCDKTTPELFVNTCAPVATFYIAGSSALGGAISKVITATTTSATSALGYFDPSSTVPVVTIVDTGSPNGIYVGNPTNANSTKAGNGVSAWYGMSRAALTGDKSVPLLVVYNSYMGSAAGVSQVMAKDVTKIPEADVVTVGPINGAANTCKLVEADLLILGTDKVTSDTKTFVAQATNKVACSSHAFTRADLAISDVNADELLQMYDVNGGVALSKLTRTPLAMQGFAIAVNNSFYDALMAAQVTSGALPSTCTAGTYTEACQPSITRAQYASLVTKQGSIKSATGFIPGDMTPLTLARRDQMSGTQASSNIYFASDICNILDAKSKVNTHGGALSVMRAEEAKTYAPGLIVHENLQTSDVENDLKAGNTAGSVSYSIGVIALSKGNSTKYKFVKLDRVSPNFAKGGTTPYGDTALRNNMIDGSWPFQMTAYAMYPTAAGNYDAKKAPKAGLIKAMVADLSNSALHDLTAIGYLDGVAAKKSSVFRPNGNNCSPLVNADKIFN
jgi:hypothetical protein